MQTEKEKTFKFVKYSNTQEVIEIHFGKNNEFWSCQRGTDLCDFDVLLEYFVPDIDLDRINYTIARWWEQELYRELSKCKQQRSASKAFGSFCERIGKKYAKKFSALGQGLIQGMSHKPLKKNNSKGKALQISGMNGRWLVSPYRQKPLLLKRTRQLQDRNLASLQLKGRSMYMNDRTICGENRQ